MGAGAELVMGQERFVRALLAMLAGCLLGKAAHVAMPALPIYWYLPMVFTLAAGLVTLVWRKIAWLPALLLIFLLMAAYSVAILPEKPTPDGLLRAGCRGMDCRDLDPLSGFGCKHRQRRHFRLKN